jgi:hypothetical protein
VITAALYLLVIPAKAGIQLALQIEEELDPGFRRDDVTSAGTS